MGSTLTLVDRTPDDDRYGKVTVSELVDRQAKTKDGRPFTVHTLKLTVVDEEGKPWTSKKGEQTFAEYSYPGGSNVHRRNELGAFLTILEENFGFTEEFNTDDLIGQTFRFAYNGYWKWRDTPDSAFKEIWWLPTAMLGEDGEWIEMTNSPQFSYDPPHGGGPGGGDEGANLPYPKLLDEFLATDAGKIVKDISTFTTEANKLPRYVRLVNELPQYFAVVSERLGK